MKDGMIEHDLWASRIRGLIIQELIETAMRLEQRADRDRGDVAATLGEMSAASHSSMLVECASELRVVASAFESGALGIRSVAP